MTIAVLIAFFLVTLLAVAAAGYSFVLKPSQGQAATVRLAPALTANEPDLPPTQAAVLEVFRRLGDMVPDSVAQRGSARRLLLMAGFRWPSTVATFLGIKVATSLTLGLTGAWAAVTFANPDAAFLPTICGMGFGYLVPDRILERLATARSARMRRGLPAALDLMVLTVEAGQGLDAAILDTSRGLRRSHPDLASEFTQLHLELRADASRVDALRNFVSRTQDSELRKFASLLIDTDRFGSSLAPALRAHSHYLRTRFRQSAQEKARKVGVKLIFPVFFLIFPSVILVTLGPAVILLFQQMDSLMGF